MAILKIIKMGHPTLRKVARDLTLEEIKSPYIQELIEDMHATMLQANGIGLAAPQVNHSVQLAVIQLEEENPRYKNTKSPKVPLHIFINPKITVLDATTRTSWEGCLSVPGLRGIVGRPRKIQVDYLDAQGNPQQIVADDFMAVVLQHELDHLQGQLYVDLIKDKSKLVYEDEWEHYLKENPEDRERDNID